MMTYIHPYDIPKNGINMKIDMTKEQERRTNSLQLSTTNYCSIILCLWI